MTERRIPVGDEPVWQPGELPVKTEITVLSAADPHARTVGLCVKENTGTPLELPEIRVIPGSRVFKPPVEMPADFNQWTLEQRGTADIKTFIPLPGLGDLSEGDLVLIPFSGGWYYPAVVTHLDSASHTGLAKSPKNGKRVCLLQYFDEYGWLMVGSGNLGGIKRLSITKGPK